MPTSTPRMKRYRTRIASQRGKRRRADRQRPLALDQTDDRAEADRQQPAHVDEEQDVPDEEAAQMIATASAVIRIVQR